MIDPLGLFGGHVAETRAGGFHAIRCTIPELTQRGLLCRSLLLRQCPVQRTVQQKVVFDRLEMTAPNLDYH